ncbi:DUF2787 domain-containing protein [Vibrio natriegens]|uniref:DUF2787 family protein n=1 Tax=Vibrio natriegens TaxID=691 RepID=UPI001EFC54E6|nr:DUF2787 family protein [Vibrio natriegens]MCG9702744.1 DUF2787 domain-containing protein [Vibrio natriegens]
MKHILDNPTIPPLLLQCLDAILMDVSAPQIATHLTLNFRHTDYLMTRQGIHPVEIRLESIDDKWSVVFVASFSYSSEEDKQVSPELYFNFKYGWFCQPDIKTCDLAHPEVTSLLESWSRAFGACLYQQLFDDIGITATKP